MDKDSSYSVESARTAGERGELSEWVAAFLASPGSDNELLGEKLTNELGWWVGPHLLPIDRLYRLAGPSGDPVVCPVDDDYWDDRVEELEEMVEEGSQLPPVVVAYRGDDLVLEDGNHRVEGLRRAGKTEAWAVVGFERAEDRDRFLAEWGARRQD